MNNRLSKAIAGIFVLLAAAYTTSYGQSSGLPNGIPSPVFHVKADEGVTCDSNGNVTQWQPIVGNNYIDISQLKQGVNSSGQAYIRTIDNAYGPRAEYDNSNEKWYKPSVFIVERQSLMYYGTSYTIGYPNTLLNVSTSDDYSYNYNYNYNSNLIYSYSYTYGYVDNDEFTYRSIQADTIKLYNIQITDHNCSTSNGCTHNSYSGYNAINNLYINGSFANATPRIFDSNWNGFVDAYARFVPAIEGEFYEILVFENLTDSQRHAVSVYLMNKYNMYDSAIPKDGLNSWVRADKGVSLRSNSGNKVERIQDQSEGNGLFVNYETAEFRLNSTGANGQPCFYWTESPYYRWNPGYRPGSNYWGNYMWRVNKDLNWEKNGTQNCGDIFVVMKPEANGYTNNVLWYRQNNEYAYTKLNGIQLQENFGRNSGSSANITLPLSMENTWTVYNVAVGQVKNGSSNYNYGWQAYLNRTLLKDDWNYVSTHMPSDIYLGFYYDSENYSNNTPFNGSFAEMIVYSRKLNDAERERVREYLMGKYNIQ